MTQRLGTFGGQLALAGPTTFGSSGPLGSFALYTIPTWPGSQLWGPSGSAFGDAVGAFGDLLGNVFGDLGRAMSSKGHHMMTDQQFATFLQKATVPQLEKHLKTLEHALHSSHAGGKKSRGRSRHGRGGGSSGGQRGQQHTRKILHRIQLIRQAISIKSQSRAMPMQYPQYDQEQYTFTPQMPQMPQAAPMEGQIPDAVMTPGTDSDDDGDDSMSGFGALGDLVVGTADLVGLGSVVGNVSDWWDRQGQATKLAVIGTLLFGFYATSTSPSVRFFTSHRGRRYALRSNPKRKAARPWSGVYGTKYQARYKSSAYKARHNRRRSRR